jgi:cytochrome P450
LKFDPERFSPENEHQIKEFSYIPFGGGARSCIGEQFAMTEAVLILATLGRQFKLRLKPDTQVTSRSTGTLGVEGGLPMRISER